MIPPRPGSLLFGLGYYFQLRATPDRNLLLLLFRDIGVSDDEWLAKMPPTWDIHPNYGDVTDMFDPVVEDRSLGEYWVHNVVGAVYIIPKLKQSEGSKETIIARRNEVLFWMWSHYNRVIVSPLHDMLVEWWKGLDLDKVRRIAIRANNEKYVAAELTERGQLVANRDWIREWETFQLIARGDGKVALCAWNKQFVAAELYTDLRGLRFEGELVANKNWIGNWETFQLTDLGNNTVAFRAYNGKYVCGPPGPSPMSPPGTPTITGTLFASSDRAGPQETFKLVEL